MRTGLADADVCLLLEQRALVSPQGQTPDYRVMFETLSSSYLLLDTLGQWKSHLVAM